MIDYVYLGLIELNLINMIDAMCQAHQLQSPKREGRVMSHDDSIEHTGLVTKIQAMVSNDASRP